MVLVLIMTMMFIMMFISLGGIHYSTDDKEC